MFFNVTVKVMDATYLGIRSAMNLLQLKEGRRERKRENAREKEQRSRKRERALESILPETDLWNPSQPTDTQNWDSVIVSSVRGTSGGVMVSKFG